ncbi:XdhC family protein [Qipengyuania sp. SS22]|uniref:XdhC family protein n=1 Tax=Qipengyuania sp. SS22 TaxID=2979461 RepID=UPI0021E5D5A1|nr:XdhC family protein [Qipengyuania sp. SS22]UYH55014.1 XdhC family protein [Qipengyuania sp. SS22]
MLAEQTFRQDVDEDHAALVAACEPGVGLCTIVGIEGSFSRRLGAQLAVRPDGTTIGNLSDGCLEAQLVSDLHAQTGPRVIRYGSGSAMIDFRLPCGGGLDILLDPAPQRIACRDIVQALDSRRPAVLPLPSPSPLAERRYQPRLKIAVIGEGPELEAFAQLGAAMRLHIETHRKDHLTLGSPAPHITLDRWTAALLLFHDHEWEAALFEQITSGEAFYIGAQGGENARMDRALTLAARGVDEQAIASIRSPIGLIPSCKSPTTLALSALAEIVAEYERLRAAD